MEFGVKSSLDPNAAPGLRSISSDELKTILQNHNEYLSSHGKSGKRADLKFTDLQGYDLNGAHLEGADLTGANLGRTSFRNAFMKDANLTSVKSLIAKELAGADVCCTVLPGPIAEFVQLENIAEASKNATVVFFSMLSACLYCLIALGNMMSTTKDGVKLPVLDATIIMPAFHIIGSVVLISIFLYFHLQLLRLWELLAELPAIFPDGVSLDKKAYPWLFNGVVAAYLPRLSDPDSNRRPQFMPLQTIVAMFLGCWTVPFTLLMFWAKYLPIREGSNIHWSASTVIYGVLVVVAAAIAVYCHGLAKATLLHERPKWGRAALAAIISAAVIVLLALAVQDSAWIKKYESNGSEQKSSALFD
jgi:Pentapeptide repeats (8 copies)